MNGKSIAIAAALAAAAGFASAAPNGPRTSQNHVPESTAKVRPILREASTRNHIALVNVAGAVPAEDWALATTYAVSLLQLNVWTNSLDKSVADRLLTDPGCTSKALGDKAKIAVYLENRPGQPALVVASPGAWSVVNVAAMKQGSPSPQVYRDRIAKCVMKGLAAAAGGGATLEPFCSLFYGAQTVEGMDKTNIAISPMCYFPMLEILRVAGGEDMISPAEAE